MQMSIAKNIKKYGDKIETKPCWEAKKVNVLEDIVYHKFSQIPSICNKLCDTMNLPLYEATSNQFWGCGLKMNARQWSTGIYPGRNIMGQILMRVRTRLQDSRAAHSSTAAHTSLQAPSGTTDGGSLSTPGYAFPQADPSVTMRDEVLQPPTAAPPAQTASSPMSTSTVMDAELTHMGDSDKSTQNVLTTSTPMITHTGILPELPVVEEEPPDYGDTSLMDAEPCVSGLESSSCSSHSGSLLGELTTNGELDSVKISSWKLPKVKKFDDSTLFSDNKSTSRKDRAPYNIKERKKGEERMDESQSRRRRSSNKHIRQNRSFVNSCYKKDLTSMGYDTESQYIKNIERQNMDNITSRKSNSNKSWCPKSDPNE